MTATVRKRVTVLIAEDHAVVAEGIELVLRPYFAVVGQVRTLSELIPTMHERKPDVVVLDITFGEESSIPLMKKARGKYGLKSEFVMLTAHESRALAAAAMAAGALGFVVKGSSGKELRMAIDAAAAGRRYSSMPTDAMAKLKRSVSGARDRIAIGGVTLTRRQFEVMILLKDGMPRPEIAGRMGITVKGVEYIVATVKALTGIARLFDLIRWLDEYTEQAMKAKNTAAKSDP